MTAIKWLPVWIVLLSAYARGDSTDGVWKTFHHGDFSFEYPAVWTINIRTSPVQHYRDVYVALNNFGREGFEVRDWPTVSGPNYRLESSGATAASQLPKRAVYLDVATWEGPPLPSADRLRDTDDKKIASLLNEGEPTVAADKQLLGQQIEFWKKGKKWSICVYQRTPIRNVNRAIIRRILASFHPGP